MHNRTPIRKYVRTLLRSKIPSINNRVWSGRPSPRYLDLLPCILISYGPEQVEVISGDEKSPKEYERRFRLQIDVLTRDCIDPDVDDWDPEMNDTAEDEADEIAGEVEKTLSDDWTLGRMLKTWNPEEGAGLSQGLRIISTDPYTIGSEMDPRALVQRITIEIPYTTPAYINKKYSTFKEYAAEFLKTPYSPTTIDPVLTSAEGKI